MSEIRYCRRCKRLFTYVTGPVLCGECIKKEDEDFKKVRDYLRQFPGSTLMEVAKATEVSSSRIRAYLREGRLEVSPDSPIVLHCERCGEPIRTGRFCNECMKKVSSEMKRVGKTLLNELDSKSANEKLGEGFRYLHKEKK